MRRSTRITIVKDQIAYHLERADNLEQFGDHWWRASKYAWLHAAHIHRIAAKELTAVLEYIEATGELA